MATQDYADFGTLEYAQRLAENIGVDLYDEASLLGLPFLAYMGSANGSGSDTLRKTFVDLGSALDASSVAEGADIPRSELAFGHKDVTIARLGVAVGQTDLLRLTNQYGQVDLLALSAWMVNGMRNKMSAMVAALAPGFSQSVGSTGTALTVTTVLSGMTTLELSAFVGDMFGMFGPKQLADFRESLRTEGGALQYAQATQEQVLRFGSGFRGSWGPLQLFSSSRVATANANADYDGLIATNGAAMWRDGVPPSTPGELEARFGALLLEYERAARAGDSGVVMQTYFGTGEHQDAAACRVLSRRT